MAQLGVGKVRGMTTLSDRRGIFHILACDQRGAIRRMMNATGIDPTYERVVSVKLDIVGVLSRTATGALLDPEYGAGPAVAHRALAGSCGLVVAVEETGYAEMAGERVSSLLEGWSVANVKAMGASAAKLLIYFNPKKEASAEQQEALVEQVATECSRLDLPFMLECLVYPTDPERSEDTFLQEREELVIESARRLSRFDVDLYKVEFPHHPALEGTMDDWVRSCERLSEACRVPWALLSAGVDFDTYAAQLEAACRAGASGFVGGRAIWKEAVALKAGPERDAFLEGEMPARFKRLFEIAGEYGRPWHEVASHRYTPDEAAPPAWYTAYARG